MRAIKSKNTKIEKVLSAGLWGLGYRFSKNTKTVTGRPDIVFRKYKVAVFCDSEFWHGYKWKQERKRIKSNRRFWYSKIENNIKRDRHVNHVLKKSGWIVLRFWGRDILNKTEKCINKIQRALHQREYEEKV
jgi:DNA mismatch endonuclease (patch repair protein)